MQGTDYWVGREVEGKLSPIPSVFCRYKIPKNYENYPHIYFTVEYIDLCISDTGGELWNTISNILDDEKQYVTLEVIPRQLQNNKIPPSIFNRAHILLRVSCPEFEQLKSTDTVTIDIKPFNVYTITKYNMQKVTSENYVYDRRET
jgi:hypothetical protein